MGSIPNGSAPLSSMRSPDLYTTLPGRTGKAQVSQPPPLINRTIDFEFNSKRSNDALGDNRTTRRREKTANPENYENTALLSY